MSDPESISLGGSLPQWMRARPDAKNDDGASFGSPPAHDDSFFYIRYPIGKSAVAAKKTQAGQIASLSEQLGDVQLKTPAEASGSLKHAQPAENVKPQQFAKHTEPCKMFMQANSENPAAPLPTFAHVKNQTKPFGTDDGFDGEGAACGTSIVRVARQMVSGSGSSKLSRGFTVANFGSDLEAHPEENSDHHPHSHPHPDKHALALAADLAAEQRRIHNSRNQTRRGSKSLPASPLGSPKSMRKAQPNPYFCGTGFGGFGGSSAAGSQAGSGANTPSAAGGSNTAGSSSGAASTGGWFLSGLLGYQRGMGGDIALSTNSVVSNISEEAEEVHGETVNPASALAARSSSTDAAASNKSTQASAGTAGGPGLAKSSGVPQTAASFMQPKKPQQVKKAQPSELREMNFWSPTSM